MKLKAPETSFVILTFPLFVCGQVSIQESGSLTDQASYILDCTISPFTSTATWAKDGMIQSTCTSTVCDTTSSGVYTFSTSSSGIQVEMNPVSISIDGLWKCTSSAGPFEERNVTSTRIEVTTDGSTEGTTTTPTTNTTTKPSKSPNKCLYYIEAESCEKIYIGFGITIFCIFVVFPTVGGVIYWKRNHKKTSSEKEQPSDPGPRQTKNETGNMEMH